MFLDAFILSPFIIMSVHLMSGQIRSDKVASVHLDLLELELELELHRGSQLLELIGFPKLACSLVN